MLSEPRSAALQVRAYNWGGITTLLEDGDLLLGGFFAVKRYDIGHLR